MTNSRVYLYFGQHPESEEVPAIMDWLGLLKRSVLLFDEVFVSNQPARQVDMQRSRGETSWPREDFLRISQELKAIRANENRILKKLPGIGEGKILATAHKAVKQVNVYRGQKLSASERQNFDFQVQRLRVKFPNDESMQDPLTEHIQTVEQGYGELFEEKVSSELDAPLHKSYRDLPIPAQEPGQTELVTLDEILVIKVPRFDNMPLDEVLDLRKEPGWKDLRGFVNHISASIRKAALEEQDPTIDLRKQIDRKLFDEASNELLKSKSTFTTLTLSYAKGLIGLIPVIGEILTVYDFGDDTERFLNDRKHWVTFLSKVDQRASKGSNH